MNIIIHPIYHYIIPSKRRIFILQRQYIAKIMRKVRNNLTEKEVHSFLLENPHGSSFNSLLSRTRPCLFYLFFVPTQLSNQFLQLLIHCVPSFIYLITKFHSYYFTNQKILKLLRPNPRVRELAHLNVEAFVPKVWRIRIKHARSATRIQDRKGFVVSMNNPHTN